MTSEVNYVQNLTRSIDSLRSIIRLIDISTGPGKTLILGTFITILVSAFYHLFLTSKKKQKRKRLIATTPRSAFDDIGKFTSDILAFVVFPLFVVLYVIVDQWIITGGKVYEGKVLTVGYLLHSSSGSLYFIAGGLQFYSPLRQRYPRVHRCLGYIYYFMAMLTSVGITLLALKPHSGFSTQLAVISFLPLWVLCNISAFCAIVIYRDVELHRQLNILALSLATSIVFMRPAVVLIMLVETEWEFGRALALAVWVVFIWFSICAAVYVIHAYTLPTMRFPRLQHNGEVVTTGSAYCALDKMISGVVSIVSFKCLDSRTIILRLGTNKFRNIDQIAGDETEVFHPVIPISCPPGSHISLKLGSIVREFTPMYSSESANELEIVVRLVRNGAFSSVLLSLLDLNFDGPPKRGWTECSLDCGVYGPLLPLPAKFGYRPYYSPRPLESCYSDPCRPTLIMIGGGSGVMPFFSVIAAALKNKNDRMILKLLSLSGSSQGTKGSGSDSSSDFGTFIEDKINQLNLSCKNETDLNPAVKPRFEGINFCKRFNISMLDSWIQDLSSPVSKDTSAVRTAADSTIVWICGPPGFGESCCVALMAHKGLQRDQIFILGIEDR